MRRPSGRLPAPWRRLAAGLGNAVQCGPRPVLAGRGPAGRALPARGARRFEAMDRRFDMAEERNQAAHAAICESIAKLDERTRTDTAALHERFDGLDGRFDDLYRHLLGAPAKTGLPPAPAAG